MSLSQSLMPLSTFVLSKALVLKKRCFAGVKWKLPVVDCGKDSQLLSVCASAQSLLKQVWEMAKKEINSCICTGTTLQVGSAGWFSIAVHRFLCYTLKYMTMEYTLQAVLFATATIVLLVGKVSAPGHPGLCYICQDQQFR